MGEFCVQTRQHFDGFAEPYHFEMPQRGVRVGFREKRHRRRVLRKAMPVGETGVLFLQPAGVGQHQRTQVGRARGAEDSAVKTVGDETWQQAGVIDVRVREDDRVDRRGMNRQRPPVAAPQFLQSLKLTAINEETTTIDLEQVLRAGNGTGGAEKRQSSHIDNEAPLSAKTGPERRWRLVRDNRRQDFAQCPRNRRVTSDRRRGAASQSDRCDTRRVARGRRPCLPRRVPYRAPGCAYPPRRHSSATRAAT